MRQRALKDGVIGCHTVKAGEVFDYFRLITWAESLEEAAPAPRPPARSHHKKKTKEADMGATPSMSAANVAPEPETVKYTENEVAQARADQKAAAAKRYGVSGTNVTQGSVSTGDAPTKKKTLGGE